MGRFIRNTSVTEGIKRTKIMKVWEYLGQIRLLDRRINRKIEERKELFARILGVKALSISPDRVQTSPVPDKTADLLAEYMDMEKQINETIDEYVRLKNKIIDEIHQLGDVRYEEVLYLKYVKYMRLEEIACVMKKSNGDYYSYDHIKRLHGEALKKFENDVEMPPSDVLL